MKLNYRRTVLVGLAFFSICAFWQMFNNVIPLILTNTFHVSEAVSGVIMAANNLHGAVVYGIGNSTEAVYYVDTGAVECLVVPDAFNVGYQSLTEIAKNLRNYFHEAGDHTVSHTVLRKENLFSKENQELLFTMSQ